jgi:hypothetical protein
MRMKTAWLACVAAAGMAHAAGPQHFSLTASYVPPEKGARDGVVAVQFTGTDPEIHINELPAPRIKLDPDQTILVDKQAPPPEHVAPYDPTIANYIDISLPVVFPATIAKGAPKGAQTVAATVTYFYCSKREGWCRKGTTEVAVNVKVP